MTTPSVRLLPPPGARSPIAICGVSYDPLAAAYVDVPHQHSGPLEANGWAFVSLIGPTSSRPPALGPSSGNPYVAAKGLKYIDSSLGAVIVFDGLLWRDAITAAAV